MFAAAAVLAPAHIRTVVGTGIVSSILRRRSRHTTSVGRIGICRMARLRRARRNEPTLLGGPLRRIRAIRVLFVRIHAAHYRRKGAAAQRNSCPVRLFFTKAARWASFERNATLVAAPATHTACFRHMRSSPFRCGFPRASPHIFPRAVKARNRAQPEFCSKSVSNVACAPRS